MTIRQLILAGAALTALTACSDRGEDVADANVAAEPANLDGGAPPLAEAETPAAFASTVAASDQFEIESGKLAATNAASAEVKGFGAMLVTEHEKSTTDLKAAAGPTLAPTPTLDADQTAKLAALKAAKGTAFDTLFKEQQVAAHRKAHGVLTAYAENGTSEPLRSFATKTAPVVKQHLDKAEALAGASR